MGQKESLPKAPVPEVRIMVDHNKDQDQTKQIELRHLSLMLLLPVMFVLLTGGYSLIWYLVRFVDGFIWTPLVSFCFWALDTVMPFWFIGRCSLAGYWPGHCWSLSYLYPYGFMQQCRNLGVGSNSCWELVRRFPHEFTHHCWSVFGYEFGECLRLVNMI